ISRAIPGEPQAEDTVSNCQWNRAVSKKSRECPTAREWSSVNIVRVANNTKVEKKNAVRISVSLPPVCPPVCPYGK
uniref:Uncharacterized protein n=1 Tax=Anopheles dirus TaxID=7168 RepID=A0A182NVR8_9DIPT